MELLPGRTLAQRLEDGPLPPRVALRVLSEVAAALAAAHAQDLVHRDVKPSNVMLTPTGAKVVDFGIAAVVGRDELEADGLLLGTPAYLAPERLTLGQVSPASDIYALGLLIYRALTNRLPWLADTTTQMLDAHVYVEPEPLPPLDGIPPEVNEICDRVPGQGARRPAGRRRGGDGAGHGRRHRASPAGRGPGAGRPGRRDGRDHPRRGRRTDRRRRRRRRPAEGRPGADHRGRRGLRQTGPPARPTAAPRCSTAAGAVLVAGAVVAALVVPSDDPSGSADAAGAGTETAAITASPSPGATVGPLGATPTSTPGDLGTVGQGSGSSGAGGPGAGPQATGGPGSGSGSGEGSGNGSGSGSGEEPGADDPDDDPPPRRTPARRRAGPSHSASSASRSPPAVSATRSRCSTRPNTAPVRRTG